MEDLNLRDDIIITKADKGGALVVVDVNCYINEQTNLAKKQKSKATKQ